MRLNFVCWIVPLHSCKTEMLINLPPLKHIKTISLSFFQYTHISLIFSMSHTNFIFSLFFTYAYGTFSCGSLLFIYCIYNFNASLLSVTLYSFVCSTISFFPRILTLSGIFYCRLLKIIYIEKM